jgi:ferritin-like metal-binding protein YciE
MPPAKDRDPGAAKPGAAAKPSAVKQTATQRSQLRPATRRKSETRKLRAANKPPSPAERPSSQAEVSPSAAGARRDELLKSLAEAEDRLHKLRSDAEKVRGGIDESRREAEEMAGTFLEVSQLMDAARVNVEAVRRSVEEADQNARAAAERADRVKEVAARIREELDLVREQWLATRDRSCLPVVETERMPGQPGPAAGQARAATSPAPGWALAGTEPPGSLPELTPIRADEPADCARDRLIRYLNDAWATEKEQADLLQDLADSTDDPELRSELEAHRELCHRHQTSIGELVRSLGAEPAGGHDFLGAVVTRLWDALHTPRDNTDEAIETLLKALSAVEFEAGMYLSVYALARAIGDEEVADLAARHLREERDFAGRLRDRITPTAIRSAERPGEAASDASGDSHD